MRSVIVLACAVISLLTATGSASAEPPAQPCERGEFCVWPTESYTGDPLRLALENTNPEECVPLPAGFDGRSFANLTKRPVTVYQGENCDTEGEFDTYPGGGTFVPAAPYLVRGVQIWNY